MHPGRGFYRRNLATSKSHHEKKETLTASMSQRQPTREAIKTDNGWAWLDKVLAEEVAYVSVSEDDEDEGEEDGDNQSVAMSNEV